MTTPRPAQQQPSPLSANSRPASTSSHTLNTANALFYGFLALIFWLPLPLGSNRPWAWSLLAAVSFGLLAIVMVQAIKQQRLLATNRQQALQLPHTFKQAWPLWGGLLAFQLWLMVQLLPLPLALLDTIAPAKAAIYHQLNQLGHTDNSWVTLSLDPKVTQIHLLQGLSYSTTALLSLLLITNQQRLKWLAYTLLAAGLCQAVYGSFMTLSSVEYGFFFPKEGFIGNATGTFWNRNHFANYVTLCLCAGTGLLLAGLYNRRSKNWRERTLRFLNALLGNKARIRLGLAMMVIALVLSHSRMGNTAFFFSLVGVGFLWLLLTKRFTRGAIILLVSLVVIDLFIVGAWFGIDKVKERLEGSAFQKETRDEVYRDTFTMIGDHWVIGTGAGSFYGVFPNYHQDDVYGFYDHTHNDYLQFAAEHGVVGFGLLLFMVLTSLKQALITLRERKTTFYQAMAFAPIMAISVLALHSLTDFNLQLPANAITFILLLCMAWQCRFLPRERSKT